MTLSFTGLFYLFGLFGLGLLTRRFFQYWKREKTIVSKFFLWSMAIFSLSFLITVIDVFFFAKNPIVLWILDFTVATFLYTLACALLGYLILYIKFPKVNPWFGFFIVLIIGLTATVFTTLIPFRPAFDEKVLIIDWHANLPPEILRSKIFLINNILRATIFLITFLPLSIILFQEAIAAKSRELKIKIFGLALIYSSGLVAALISFLIETYWKSISPMSDDIAIGVMAFFILLLTLLTQKTPSADLKKI